MSNKLISDELLNSLVWATIQGVRPRLQLSEVAAKHVSKYRVTSGAYNMGPNKVIRYQVVDTNTGRSAAHWSLCANPSNCGVIDMYYLFVESGPKYLMEIVRAILFAETKAYPTSPDTDTPRAMLAVTYNIEGNEGYATYKLLDFLCDTGWGECVTRSPIAFYNYNSARNVGTALIMRKPFGEIAADKEYAVEYVS